MNQPNPKPRSRAADALLRALRALDKVVSFIESWALSLGIMLMALVSIANVIARDVFGRSLTFAEEVDQILIVMVTFIGVGYAARLGRHIRMTALYDQLPALWQRWLMVVVNLSTGALLWVLAWYGGDYVLQTQSIGSVTPALKIPLWLVYASAPVGLALGGLQFLMTGVRNILADEPYVSFVHPDRHEPEETPSVL